MPTKKAGSAGRRRVPRAGGPPVYRSYLTGKIKRSDLRKAIMAVLEEKAKAAKKEKV
jgi:hypothetical protein